MKFRKPFRILCFFFWLTSSLQSQDHIEDSLRLALKNAKHDTARAHALLGIGDYLYYSRPDTSYTLWEKAKSVCEKNLKSNLSPILKKTFRNHLATSLQDIALVYQDRGKIPEALNYLFEAIRLKSEVGDKEGIGNVNLAIGSIYAELENKEKALEYYFKALKNFTDADSQSGIAATTNNIGTIFFESNELDKALLYFEKTEKIVREFDDKMGLAYVLGSIGTIYDKTNPIKALSYYEKSLVLHEEVGNKHGQATSLNYIGNILYQQKKFIEAEKYYKKSLDISLDIRFPETIQNAARELSGLYKMQNKGMKALEMFELYYKMRDTISTQAARKASIQKHIQYEYDKKAAEDSLIHVEKTIQEEIKHNEAIKQQRIYTYSGIVGFLLMLVIAGISFRAFKNKQKANEIISEQKAMVEGQKHMIEEKQKEIIDSIMYARRIQRSLLANEKHMQKTITRLKDKNS